MGGETSLTIISPAQPYELHMNQTQQRRRRSSSRRASHSRRNHTQRSGGNRSRRGTSTFDVSRYINTATPSEPAPTAVVDHVFADFGLDATLERTITAQGFTAPTPIQDKIIPHILRGVDVIGLSNTGTGKTAAFLIPLIEKALQDDTQQTLILAPTRELAIQIQNELRLLTKGLTMYATVCVGGMNITPQLRSLRRKNHFIIGTPGRVIDVLERGCLQPERITSVVLDEADRMLDMGFIADMRTILSRIPTTRHTMLFSATMSPHIKKLIDDFLKNPVTVSVKQQDITTSIEQDVVRIAGDDKFDVLARLLADTAFSRVLVFGAMKHSVERLSKQLKASGIRAESIHGNKSHTQRQRALQAFKEGRAQVLVATDVAARGIHVDAVSHVINYDLPNTYEDYVHRIGRTGRGAHRGRALTFVA